MVYPCVGLFLLLSSVRCTLTYPLSSTFLENGKDVSDRDTTNPVPSNDVGNVIADQATSADNVNSVNTTNPPEGTGMFKDPLEVLGPKFPDSVIVNLCQVKLFVTADVITDIVFLDNGIYLCNQVCRQYQNAIEFDGPTTVSLIKGFCDYIGITDFSSASAQGNQAVLSTECTCAYKIRCNKKTNVIMYTFQASSTGFLKVYVTEPNQKHRVT